MNTCELAKPAITKADTYEHLIEIAADQGAAIMDLLCDVEEMQKRVSFFVEMDDRPSSIPLGTAFDLVPEAEDISLAIEAYGSYRFGSADLLMRRVGDTTDRHIDQNGRYDGFSLLVPIFHYAQFTTHNSATGAVERVSTYSPGQALLLRQTLETEDPQMHSAVSLARPQDLKWSLQRATIAYDGPLA